MKYTLEYVNEDAEIAIVRFNTETKELEYEISAGTSPGYVEPGPTKMYLCVEGEKAESFDGRVMQWSQKLSTMEAMCEDGPANAYEMINDLREEGALVEMFERMIATLPK